MQEYKEAIKQFYDYCKKEKYHNIGYPENADFDYSELKDFLDFSLNNVGDPFKDSTYKLNSLKFEKEVLEFFMDLFKISREDGWGYVTTGGTEGNLYGVYVARELYPDSILYYSEDAHYSVDKIARILRMDKIKINSLSNGEIDYNDLKINLEENKEKVPIIFANIGTTMKGAIDNLDKINQVLDELSITKKYIHCDAALSGMILPFFPEENLNFAKGLDSVAISGHKFIGSPIPCGIVITKKDYVNRISKEIDYIKTIDNTITGSRNGLTPLILWSAINKLKEDGFYELSFNCIQKADYFYKKLNDAGINAWRNKNSITIFFENPSQELCKKWCLASNDKIAHVITTPHVSYKRLNTLIEEICNGVEK